MSTYTIGSDPGDDYTSWANFNTAVPSPAAGSIISFRKGETFREQITVAASGSDGSPITYTAHGTGADPIINGADIVSTWTANEETITVGNNTNQAKVVENPVTWNHTVAAGDNRILIVVWTDDQSDATVSGITYNSVALTKAVTGAQDQTITEIWYLLNPATGSNEISISLNSSSDNYSAGAVDFHGVKQQAPTATANDNDTSTATISVSLTPTDNNSLIVDGVCGNNGSTTTPGASQVEFFDAAGGSDFGAGSYKVLSGGGGSSTSMSQTASASLPRISQAAVAFSPAGNEDVWTATCTTEPNQVFFDGARGTLQASAAACTGAGHWFWAANVLYVYYTEDPDGAVVIEASVRDYAIYINGPDYITVQDLELKHSNGSNGCINVGGTSTNCTLDNLTISYATGIGIQGWFNSANLTITDCTISYAGSHGISIGPLMTTVLIDGNTVSNCVDEGIRVGLKAGQAYGVNNVTIQNNNVSTVGGNGISVQNAIAGYAKVYNNTVTAAGQVTAGCSGISLYLAGNSGAIEVMYNLCHTNNQVTTDGNGIIVDTDSDDVLVAYNICYDNDAGGINLTGCDGAKVYNNVCYNNEVVGAATMGAITVTDNVTNALIKNNILYGRIRNICVYASSVAGFTSDYNSYYSDGATRFTLSGSSYNFADWKTNSSQDASSLITDPLMTDPGNGDFTLQPASPCREKGANVGLTSDYNGDLVPQGATDIGAYEYPGSGALFFGCNF